MEQTFNAPKVYSIGKLLAESWRIFWRAKLLFVSIVLMVSAILLVCLFLFPFRQEIWQIMQEANSSLNATHAEVNQRLAEFMFPAGNKVVSIIQGVLLGLCMVVMWFQVAMVAYVVKLTDSGAVITLGEVIKQTFFKLPRMFWTTFLSMIFFVGLSLLLIVPGMIYGIYWIFGVCAVVLNSKVGIGALKYSKSVVQGRWWRVVFYLFVLNVLVAFTAFLTQVLFALILPENIWFDSIVKLIVFIEITFYWVAFVKFYLNLEHTKIEKKNKAPAN